MYCANTPAGKCDKMAHCPIVGGVFTNDFLETTISGGAKTVIRVPTTINRLAQANLFLLLTHVYFQFTIDHGTPTINLLAPTINLLAPTINLTARTMDREPPTIAVTAPTISRVGPTIGAWSATIAPKVFANVRGVLTNSGRRFTNVRGAFTGVRPATAKSCARVAVIRLLSA